MKTKPYRWLFILPVVPFLLFGAGCGEAGPAPESESRDNPSTKTSSVKSDTLPLIQIMMNLEQNMNSLQAGIWRENYSMIEQAARSIGNHAKIPKHEIKTIRSILGNREFQTFVSDDKTVHHTALELADSAKKNDLKTVTEQYTRLYNGCVSCHLNHRNKIRKSQKWP